MSKVANIPITMYSDFREWCPKWCRGSFRVVDFFGLAFAPARLFRSEDLTAAGAAGGIGP